MFYYCYNRVTLFANFPYIRVTRHVRATIYCRPNVFATLFRQMLLSEIAHIAFLDCKTHTSRSLRSHVSIAESLLSLKLPPSVVIPL